MPGGKHGPGGKWIHDRANHILQKSDDLEGKRGKSVAYALATQQAHRVGKSPKSFRTAGGVREAKQKYDKPKSEYTQTANPKTAADMIVDAWLRKHSAGPPPSIPTPQFPTGLQKVTPKSVKSMSTAQPGKTTANTYTQVHSQPPAVNSAPYSGVKSATPPPATR